MRESGKRACAVASIGTTWLNASALPARSRSTAGCGVSTGTRIRTALVMIFSRCSPCALRAGTTMRTPARSTSGMLLIGEAAGTRNVVRRPMTTGPKSNSAARSLVIPMNVTSILPERNASIMSAGLWMRTRSCGTPMRRASSAPSSGLHPLRSPPSSLAKYESIRTATRSLPVGASSLESSVLAVVCAAARLASPDIKVASASAAMGGDMRPTLLRLRLQRVELRFASQGQHAHLAGAVDRHDGGDAVAALEQRDVADLGAAHRQVEHGPGVRRRVVAHNAVRGPQVAPHSVLAVDRDVVRLHRGVGERNDRGLERLRVDPRERRAERVAHPQEVRVLVGAHAPRPLRPGERRVEA